MRFLTKLEWEKLLNLLSFNKNSSLKETTEELFFEITQTIKRLTNNLKDDKKTYGIAMTLFHYYVSLNGIRNIDKMEICFACIYMSSKIQFINFSLNKYIEDYKNYIKNIQGYDKKNPTPDLIKYEIQLYSQLGYDLDIETPFQFFFSDFLYKFPFITNNKESFEKIKNFSFNLISDTYSRPLSIYYHPKIIYLSCCIFAIKFLEYNELFDINKLLQNENIDLVAECMEYIYQIYSRFIEGNSVKNNYNSSINNSNSK